MSDCPRFTLLLPVRHRTTMTSNALVSALLRGERRDHEVQLVVDRVDLIHDIRRRRDASPNATRENSAWTDDAKDCSLVDKWLEKHAGLLSQFDVRITRTGDDPSLFTGGLRCAGALNIGLAQAKYEWIVGLVDEDLVFQENWDALLWNHMRNRDPNRTCVSPMMLMPRYFNPRPEPTEDWLEQQRRSDTRHQWPLPVSDDRVKESAYRLPYAEFDEFVRKVSRPGAWEEPCGQRDRGHWVPSFCHRDLERRIGGWPTDEAHNSSIDIGHDDRLSGVGVTKVVCKDAFVLHTKCRAYWNDQIDRDWVWLPQHLVTPERWAEYIS